MVQTVTVRPQFRRKMDAERDRFGTIQGGNDISAELRTTINSRYPVSSAVKGEGEDNDCDQPGGTRWRGILGKARAAGGLAT